MSKEKKARLDITLGPQYKQQFTEAALEAQYTVDELQYQLHPNIKSMRELVYAAYLCRLLKDLVKRLENDQQI